MRYDRRSIMRDAHRRHRETDLPFGECLKAAWVYAKSPKQVAIKPELILPPAIQVAKSAIALAKKLKSSRIEVAGRLHVDLGIRVTPKDEAPVAYVMSKQVSGGYERRPNA